MITVWSSMKIRSLRRLLPVGYTTVRCSYVEREHQLGSSTGINGSCGHVREARRDGKPSTIRMVISGGLWQKLNARCQTCLLCSMLFWNSIYIKSSTRPPCTGHQSPSISRSIIIKKSGFTSYGIWFWIAWGPGHQVELEAWRPGCISYQFLSLKFIGCSTFVRRQRSSGGCYC